MFNALINVDRLKPGSRLYYLQITFDTDHLEPDYRREKTMRPIVRCLRVTEVIRHAKPGVQPAAVRIAGSNLIVKPNEDNPFAHSRHTGIQSNNGGDVPFTLKHDVALSTAARMMRSAASGAALKATLEERTARAKARRLRGEAMVYHRRAQQFEVRAAKEVARAPKAKTKAS